MNRSLLLIAIWVLGARSTWAQEAVFYRVSGPVPSHMTQITRDGWLSWTNVQTDGTFTVHRCRLGFVPGPLNGFNLGCVEYAQVPTTNPVTTLRVHDPNPPKDMVLIPAGTFTMGDAVDGSSAALPLHSVYVSAFYMDQYEVTRTRWDTVNAWATNHGYTALTTGEDKGSNHPVRVAWWIAARWCNARSEMEGLVPCYYTDARQTNVFRSGQLILQDTFVAWSASGYRLPTEAEWEKAARGGATGRRFPWSDTNVISHARANYTAIGTPLSWDLSSPGSYHPTFNDGVWPYTNPVDWFPAYGYGLYGMAGNVSEWCWDAEGDYPSTPQSDPHGPDGATIYTNRIVRGGSFNLPAGSCAVARRTSISPGSQGWGVRCVRVMPP